MSEQERRLDEERRLRQARIDAVLRQPPEPAEPADSSGTPQADGEPDEDDAAGQRIEQQALWVDLQVRKAMERGEFDDLPGAGKPIKGLGGTHDPDWWVKGLIEREQITGVLPPALALRREDAELDAVVDKESTEQGVRRVVADFNRRVVDARRQLQGGPPVITPTRDADTEVAAWQDRIAQRRLRQREQLARLGQAPEAGAGRAGSRRFWRRLWRRPGR